MKRSLTINAHVQKDGGCQDEENKQTKIEFEIDIANHDHFSVDMYNALYNLLSDDDVKKANMNNND